MSDPNRGEFRPDLSPPPAVAVRASSQADLTPARRRVHLLSWIVAAIGATSLALQRIQVEDSTPMMLYFTVWSAVLTSAIWPLVDTTTSHIVRIAAQSAAVGTIFSGTVYWIALFPINGAGTQLATILANVSLHALLPVATIARILLLRESAISVREVLITTVLPLLYLTFTLAILRAVGIQSPYVFLRPSAMNLWITCPLLLALWLAVSYLLRAVLTRISQAHHQSVPQAAK